MGLNEELGTSYRHLVSLTEDPVYGTISVPPKLKSSVRVVFLLEAMGFTSAAKNK